MPVRASRRAPSSSSPPFILYNPTSQEYSGQTVSVPPSNRDSVVCCSPFMNMGIVHKLCSKVLRMSSKHPETASDPTPSQRRQSDDRELRPSRSRLSRKSSTSHEPARPKPVYRGSSPLKKSNIHLILDISPETLQGNVEQSWPPTGRFSSEGAQRYGHSPGEHEESTLSLRHQPSVLDTSFLDTSYLDTSFTLSDTHTSETRHDSPSTSKVKLSSPIEFPYPSPEDLLPPNPYFERLEREKERQRQSEAPSPTTFRQRSLHHTRTATASFSKPTPMAYPPLADNRSGHNIHSSVSLNAVESGPSGNTRAYQRQIVTSSPARYTPFPTASPIRSPSSPTQLSSLSLDSPTRARARVQQPRQAHRQPIHPNTIPVTTANAAPNASVPRRAASSLTTKPTSTLTRSQSATSSRSQVQTRPHTASSSLPSNSNSKVGYTIPTSELQPQRLRRDASVSSSGTDRTKLRSPSNASTSISANTRVATGSSNYAGRKHHKQIVSHHNMSTNSLQAPIPF